jgi:hypothetical protein
MGGTIKFDGECLSHEPGVSYPDGVYGGLVVQNGTVTELLPDKELTYTPPPCAALPAPCEDGELTVEIANDPANLSQLNLNGEILTKIITNNTPTAQLVGNGTASNPLKVNVTQTSSQLNLITSTPEVMDVTNGDIKHKTSGVSASTYLGFTVDQFGHIKSYTAPATSNQGVLSLDVVPGTLSIQSSNGAVILGLPSNFSNSSTFSTGLYRITVDTYGRITGITEEVLENLDTISSVINSGWTTFTYNFTTVNNGYLRIRYIGDLAFPYTGYGLIPLPTGLTVALNNTNLNGYAFLTNNRVSGIEIRTTNIIASGSYSLVITAPNTVTSTGILEVFRCR